MNSDTNKPHLIARRNFIATSAFGSGLALSLGYQFVTSKTSLATPIAEAAATP